jgi:hypothetical protein
VLSEAVCVRLGCVSTITLRSIRAVRARLVGMPGAWGELAWGGGLHAWLHGTSSHGGGRPAERSVF